ncbi:hypothetical protein DLM45_02575 [Hyphomicrobium methylovorum]|nr:hypothetical protein [Hyphomicrobium methylovorum]
MRYRASTQRGSNMRGWFSQIVIGIIVTVIGTVVANAIVGNERGSRHMLPGVHTHGSARH